MIKLPFELLNAIFLLLHQQDKVELMTVCQQWKNAIENHSLFHTVRVGSMTQLNNLIIKIQKQPIHGTRVERLILDLNLNHFEMNLLPVLFPNVRFFLDFEIYARNRIPFTDQNSPHLWNKNIEHITECYDNLNIYQILKSGSCPRLTILSTFGMSRFHESTFVRLLVNAPALTTLTIHSCRFDLSDLEILHKNVPHLKSFSCQFLFVSCEILSSDIVPATSLNTLLLAMVRVFTPQEEVLLFQYFHKKYPNLVQLSYGSSTLERTRLEIKTLYMDGLVSFIEGIGPQLKSLLFDWDYTSPCIYKLLDDAGCQIKEHTLNITAKTQYKIKQLASSNQSRFITSLTVNNTLERCSLENLKKLKALVELNINLQFQFDISQRPMINLSEVLDLLGNSLKTFSVSNVHLAFCNLNFAEYPLQRLTLNRTSFSYRLDHFISQSFPKLHTLKMKHCDWRQQTSFDLPNINLLRFEIMERFPKENINLLIETLDAKRWYTTKSLHNAAYTLTRTDSSDHLLYPAIASMPFENVDIKPFMTFVFRSLHNLRIVNGSD